MPVRGQRDRGPANSNFSRFIAPIQIGHSEHQRHRGREPMIATFGNIWLQRIEDEGAVKRFPPSPVRKSAAAPAPDQQAATVKIRDDATLAAAT